MLKLKTIQNFAFQHELWHESAKIIVGVSGGPDSACLLDILVKLMPKYAFKLKIAHVNYGLRGQDSKKDEEFVKKLGETYGIEVHVLKVKKLSSKGNLENNLRQVRYKYFEKLRCDTKFDLIAVAHSSDDQAETVLFRILRGAGLNGLSAMKPKNGKIIRPLLGTTRKEIEEYLKAHDLKCRIDESNFSKKYTRNKLRHDLLPYLEKQYNPQIKKTLSQWSQNVAEDYDFILKQAERIADKLCKNKYAHFEVRQILSQHPALQRQILRLIFQNLKGDTQNLETRHIAEILKILKSTKSKHQNSRIAGLNISKKGDKIEIFC